MKRVLALILALLTAVAVHAGAAQSIPTAITYVTVIDATGREPHPNMTVVVNAGRITRVGRSSNVQIPPTAVTVDGAGKFLIPGLWDMHVHLGGYRDALTTLPHLLAYPSDFGRHSNRALIREAELLKIRN